MDTAQCTLALATLPGTGLGVSHAEMWKAGLVGKMVRKRDVTEAGGRVRHRSKVGTWGGRTMENMV